MTRMAGPFPALPDPRAHRPFQPHLLCVPHVQAGQNAAGRGGKASPGHPGIHGAGPGIKIAMRDLEIRGAGNILGAEQHGHMEAVGYDLYCKMLNEAVLALKGETTEEESF